MRTLGLVLAGFCVTSCYAQRADPALNICDVLANIAQYNHKRITLRGEYLRGGHGLYLQGISCATPLVSRGFEWPSMLLLSVTEVEAKQFGVSLDKTNSALREAYSKIARQYDPSGDTWPSGRIMITCTGVLHTHEKLDLQVIQWGGRYQADGFGPGNAAPGVFFLEAVTTVEITPVPPEVRPPQR